MINKQEERLFTIHLPILHEHMFSTKFLLSVHMIAAETFIIIIF